MPRAMRLIALRGATTVELNESAPILEATGELMHELLERNGLEAADLVSCIFTLTEDLDAEFPAVAARNMGLSKVPLLCAREIPVPGSLPRVIRVMIHAYAHEGARAPARLPGRGAGAAARPRGSAVSERHRRLAAALPRARARRAWPTSAAAAGCTLAALRERLGPEVELIGVERREPELEPALAGDPQLTTVVADLNKPLPFEDAQPRRGGLPQHARGARSPPTPSSREVARVLAPGGHFLLGHTDLDTIVFSSSELDLTRRLVHAFADTQEEWMDSADGTIGRKLPHDRPPLAARARGDDGLGGDRHRPRGGRARRHARSAGSPTPSGATSTTTSPPSSRRGSTTCGSARRAASSSSASTTTRSCCASPGLAWRRMSIEFSERIRRIPVYPAADGYALEGRVALLASNESPYPPLPAVVEAAAAALAGANRYPDPSNAALRRALSDRHGVPANRIAIGNGSCDILLAAGEALLEPGAEIVYAWPSFSVYPHLAAASGARAIEVPLDDDAPPRPRRDGGGDHRAPPGW